jgi:hypothetical protein
VAGAARRAATAIGAVAGAIFGFALATPYKRHATAPHAEAAYRILPLKDGGFGVEVAIPNTCPTTVSRFATEAAAEERIAPKKQRVELDGVRRKWFRRPGAAFHVTRR